MSRPDGMDHALEGKGAGAGGGGGPGRNHALTGDQSVGFGLEAGAGGARDDGGNAPAVGEAAVRGVDDGVDRLA
jgi:hypothetical protein